MLGPWIGGGCVCVLFTMFKGNRLSGALEEDGWDEVVGLLSSQD